MEKAFGRPPTQKEAMELAKRWNEPQPDDALAPLSSAESGACEDCQCLADALRSAWAGGDESQVHIIELAIDTHLTGIKHE